MCERQRHREVRVEVHEVPRLALERRAREPHRRHRDRDEQHEADPRGEDVGVVRDQIAGLRPERDAVGLGVAERRRARRARSASTTWRIRSSGAIPRAGRGRCRARSTGCATSAGAARAPRRCRAARRPARRPWRRHRDRSRRRCRRGAATGRCVTDDADDARVQHDPGVAEVACARRGLTRERLVGAARVATRRWSSRHEIRRSSVAIQEFRVAMVAVSDLWSRQGAGQTCRPGRVALSSPGESRPSQYGARILNFCSLPVDVRANWSRNSIDVGHLKCASRSRQCAISACSSASAPGFSTTSALTVSPHFSSGTPMTHASATAGCW